MHTSPSGLLSVFLPVDAQTTTWPLLQHPCIGSWGCYVHCWNGHAGLCLPPAHWLHAARLQMQHCHRFLHYALPTMPILHQFPFPPPISFFDHIPHFFTPV